MQADSWPQNFISVHLAPVLVDVISRFTQFNLHLSGSGNKEAPLFSSRLAAIIVGKEEVVVCFYTPIIRSLTNSHHCTALAYLAETHNIHIVASSETWLHPNNSQNFQILFVTVPLFSAILTLFLVHVVLLLVVLHHFLSVILVLFCFFRTTMFKSFEMLTITLKLVSLNLLFTTIILSN